MNNVLIIGCGKIAGGNNDTSKRTHGGAYSARNDVQIVACLDKSRDISINYAKKFNCIAEISLKEALIRHSPNIVSVCTPDRNHYEITKSLLLSQYPPKIIFLEKPACENKNELLNLIELSGKIQSEIIVNHSRRFDAHHKNLKNRIIAGEFGRLREIHATYYGGWKHNGVHLVDTLSYLFNDIIEIVSVNNILQTVDANDPTLELNARFKSNSGKLLFFGFDENDYQLFDLDIRFDRTRLRIENFGDRVFLEKRILNKNNEKILVEEQNGLKVKKADSMEVAIDTICKSLENGEKSMLDGVRLADIAPTMYTIWQGVKIYENC